VSRAPTRASKAGKAYLALQRKARGEGRSTDELLQLAALEAFVDRLSTSARARDVVLKGGVLLAAYQLRRPTRDVDLSATHVSNDVDSVRALIDEILAEPRDDGWIYGASSAETIREADVYSGVRVTVPCALARARIVFHVDVNIGDVVWPPPATVSVPRLLGDKPIEVAGYSLSMILAEKLVTAVQRGIANTRWRDFADVYLMTGKHVVNAREVRESIRRVALHRRAALAPLSTVWAGLAELAQRKWSAWVRKQNLVDRLPLAFETVIRANEVFGEPLLKSSDSDERWDPQARRWRT
jgi:predicted nucleotidyltransferase component of viral defense system